MASLFDCVRRFREELEDGILWVAFWRERRSWYADSVNAEIVDLGRMTVKMDHDDAETLRRIVKTDKNAVLLNAEYTNVGSYGDGSSNLREIVDRVRWQYDGGYYLASDFEVVEAK